MWVVGRDRICGGLAVASLRNEGLDVGCCILERPPLPVAKGSFWPIPAFGNALSVMEDGANIIAIGKAVLENPDMPRRLANKQALDEFDASILGLIANIKSSEPAFP